MLADSQFTQYTIYTPLFAKSWLSLLVICYEIIEIGKPDRACIESSVELGVTELMTIPESKVG